MALYIKSSVKHSEQILVHDVSIKYLMFDILTNHIDPITVLTVYRPDAKMDNVFLTNWKKLLDCPTIDDKETIVIGDFMLVDIRLSQKFNRVMSIYQHTLHIYELTRVTENTSKLIDHVWSSNSQCIKQSGVIKKLVLVIIT